MSNYNLTLKMIKYEIPIFMKVVGMSVSFQMQLILYNWDLQNFKYRLKNGERFNLESTGQSYTLLS
jgi:hypothetical protein